MQKTSGSRPTFILKPLKDWEKIPEDKFSMSGLRGTVQHAIAESGVKHSIWGNST